jgi:hypothetical protein
MSGVLFTIASSTGAPSLAEASRILGVDESALDPDFGVRLIDPRQHLYAVLVDETQASKVKAGEGSVKGPFSDPRISDYGPPRSDK